MKWHCHMRLLSLILGCTLLFTSCGGQSTPATQPDSPNDSPTSANESTEGANEEGKDQPGASSQAILAQNLDPEFLKDYVFYHGIATVMEDQQWTSKFQDESHGEGDAILTSEDYLIFEPLSGNLYIVARNLTYNSKHIITVNDINGNYAKTANVSASGETQEYYSWGFIVNDTLDFAPLPIRADASTSQIITRIPTLDNAWVSYISTADTVRLAADRIMPPDTAPSLTLLNLPLLERFSDEKSYGNREARVYDATRRFWNIKGTFDYDYQKISFQEMLDGVNAILEAKANDESFSKRAESLPDVWQAAAQITDQLVMLNDASASMSTFMSAIDRIESSQPDKARAIIDTLDQQSDMTNKRVVLDDLVNASADQSSQRKLEGFVMDSDDSELKESFGPYLETIDTLFGRYATLHQSFEEKIQAITPDTLSTQLDPLVKEAQQLKELGDNMHELIELFEERLSRALEANPLKELDTLFREWPILFLANDGEKAQVDMAGGLELPLGYPLDLIPIMPQATIVLIDVVPATADAREGYMVSAKSTATEAEIITYYATILNTLSNYEKVSLPGIQILSAQGNPYYITIMITPNTLGGDEPSLIQITIIDEE